MNVALSFLFAAFVGGMAVEKSVSHVLFSSIEAPNILMLYINSSGVQTHTIYYLKHSESFPTEWIAEFIHPVDRPFDNVSDYLLAQMDNRNSWTLKPSPNQTFDAWNVQIRIPKEWRSNHSLEENYMDSDGAITAAYNLSPSSAGTEVIQSHFGNYQKISPVDLELDPTMPILLMYEKGQLIVSFSTYRVQN
ncbi:hypothetical protein KQX54_014887 [Cotesia glomerata]|uniref:Uncharacterized protein n=1 Tax=Cotesia glomerata TaxID=32391 RepID=A0AAV7IPZ3_COTGL|nr:hypothetical protein KQX54_014887 [Cotesia glomerata]